MTYQPPHHDDPLGETRTQFVQALAMLTTVGEAAARWAVTGAQNRAAQAQRRARTDRLGADASRAGDRAAAKAARASERLVRQQMDRAFDDTWLAAADIHQTAQVWRTATVYASAGDRRAREAMLRTQERLRTLNPVLMDAFHRHRVAGRTLAEAMRAAAVDVWRHEAGRRPGGHARQHGAAGDPPPAVRAGANGRAVGAEPDRVGVRLVDEMEAAVRAEVARLAPAWTWTSSRRCSGSGEAPATPRRPTPPPC